MDPQIIDFYNEIPHGINVIDKMNEEFNELQKKYDKLEKKVNMFKSPYIIVKTKEEYKIYDDIIFNQFKIKIKEFLEDKEFGLFAIVNCHDPIQMALSNRDTIYDKFNDGSWHCPKETCREKIVNELNNITNNKNKEWCMWRIETAFKSCLKKSSHLEFLDEDDIIEELIHHIYNDEDNDYLPEIYIEMCNRFVPGLGLYNLTCYHCKKCGELEFDNFDENLICPDCY